MSDSKETFQSYWQRLGECLERGDAEQLLAVRRQRLSSGGSPVENSPMESQPVSAAFELAIANLRSHWHSGTLSDLRPHLNTLLRSHCPAEQRLGERCQILIQNRDRLLAMKQSVPGMQDLFPYLIEALIGDGRTAAFARECVLAAVVDRKLRRKTVRIVKRLEAETPALAELESEWFRQLRLLQGGTNRGVEGATVRLWQAWMPIAVTCAAIAMIVLVVEWLKSSA